MKVKTDFVPHDVDYLTAGKEYEVFRSAKWGFPSIAADDGKEEAIFFNGCAHLDGAPWEIVEE